MAKSTDKHKNEEFVFLSDLIVKELLRSEVSWQLLIPSESPWQGGRGLYLEVLAISGFPSFHS